MAIQGVDVSNWQGKNVDYNEIETLAMKFVIIRAGYGSALDHPSQFDATFETNYANATKTGLDVGAYWYSYATSPEAAVREAQSCISKLKGKKFSYPIYFDLEERSQLLKGKTFCDSIIDAFCGELEKAGYYPGLYCSTYWIQNSVSEKVREKYPVWIAEYNSKCTYPGPYGIWQNGLIKCNSAAGKVVDHNYCYVDYPSIIKSKGLNGYEKTSEPTPPSKPAPAPVKKSNQEIAKEVIQGDWSAGEKRKQLLTEAGYDYSAVQAIVNSMLNSAPTSKKSIDELAREVIRGDWSAGEERKKRLTNAGYDYTKVQARVNELLKG